MYATCHLVLFEISPKYHQNISKGIPVTEQTGKFFSKQREITPKVRKAELSFLYATRHLVLFDISAKYHRNIPKGIRVTERTLNLFQIKQRVVTPKVRKAELSSFYAKRRLVLFYISTKYNQNIPKGIQVTERTRRFIPTPTGSVPKTFMSSPPHSLVRGRGGGAEGWGPKYSLNLLPLGSWN